MINRRGFLLGCLAAAAAPAIARAASLMPVRQLDSGLLVMEVDAMLKEMWDSCSIQPSDIFVSHISMEYLRHLGDEVQIVRTVMDQRRRSVRLPTPRLLR